MSDAQQESMVIVATHGPEDPERATLPFVVANAALVLDVQVTIALQGTGVLLAKKGCYEHIFAAGLAPLHELIASFLEQGGKIWVCTPCVNERKITEEMLLDEAELVAGGKLVQACMDANATLSY